MLVHTSYSVNIFWYSLLAYRLPRRYRVTTNGDTKAVITAHQDDRMLVASESTGSLNKRTSYPVLQNEMVPSGSENSISKYHCVAPLGAVRVLKMVKEPICESNDDPAHAILISKSSTLWNVTAPSAIENR
jgi:hypothetical protein